jgi:hypothetical protein
MTAATRPPVNEMPETALRHLPRSLEPLQDETLSGFVLRLAHRLCIDPGHLLRRTGLSSDRAAQPLNVRVPMNLLFGIDDQRARLFAHTTRLSPSEVSGLLLAPLGTRYGPLNPQYAKQPSTQRMIHGNSWVFTNTIRYCPECLAGDGSEIETLHGGAWRRLWRLPVVFACLRHRRFLRQHCPDCGGLTHASAPNSMIARLNDHTLHPTQCRATPPTSGKLRSSQPACGADLSVPGHNDLRALSPQTRRAVHSVQKRILELLSSSGPEQVGSVGWAVPVAQYFMDLRAVTSLIFMTWPEARPHAATPTLAQALDAEAQQRHNAFLERRTSPSPGKAGNPARAYSTPPTDPLVAAAVFEIADRFLRSPDEVAASALLGPLAAEARYAHQPVSYNIRRARGTSVPLQVVLLTHRRQARLGDDITALIERNEGLTRY